MNQKNYTEVLIDGKIYRLGGTEDEMYLQRIAAYLNEKISRLKKQEGFTRLSSDYQFVMEALNLADDYFKEQERANALAEQKASMEKDAYSLKHELVKTQLELEKLQRELEAEQKKNKELKAEEHALKSKLEQQNAMKAAAAAAAAVHQR